MCILRGMFRASRYRPLIKIDVKANSIPTMVWVTQLTRKRLISIRGYMIF